MWDDVEALFDQWESTPPSCLNLSLLARTYNPDANRSPSTADELRAIAGRLGQPVRG